MYGLLYVNMMYKCVVRVIYMLRPKQDVGCLLSLSFTLLGQGLSWNQKLTISTELAGQGTLRICLSQLPSAGAPGNYGNAWLLTEQVPSPTKLSPSPDAQPSASAFCPTTSCLGDLGHMAVALAFL